MILPQTNCREGSPRYPFSTCSSVSSDSSVSSGSSVSPCAPLACNLRSSFSLDISVLTAAAKVCLVRQLRLVGSSVSSCAPSACDTGSSLSSDNSVLRAVVKVIHRASLPAVPSYQRRPSSPRKREGAARCPTIKKQSNVQRILCSKCCASQLGFFRVAVKWLANSSPNSLLPSPKVTQTLGNKFPLPHLHV